MTREDMESKFPEGSGFSILERVIYCNVKYGLTKFIADRINTEETEVFRFEDYDLSDFENIPKPEFKFTKEPDGWATRNGDKRLVCFEESKCAIIIFYEKANDYYMTKLNFKKEFTPCDPPKDKKPWGLE